MVSHFLLLRARCVLLLRNPNPLRLAEKLPRENTHIPPNNFLTGSAISLIMWILDTRPAVYKARLLRDALTIGMVAVEELEE